MISDGKFGKKEHLLKTKEFSRVYKKGISKRSAGVVVCALPNGLGHDRLGFSISSRIVRRATTRNRIRRLFREIYRKNKSFFKTGFDIVIVVRQDPGTDISLISAQNIFFKLAKEAGVAA